MSKNELQKLLIECLTKASNNPAQGFKMAIKRAPSAEAEIKRIAAALGVQI